ARSNRGRRAALRRGPGPGLHRCARAGGGHRAALPGVDSRRRGRQAGLPQHRCARGLRGRTRKMTFLLLALLAGDVDAMLSRLAAAGKDVHALSGDFTQKKRVAAFKQELTSHGRFAFARPAHLEWRYTDPDPSALVVDGDKATLTLPDEPPQTYDLARQPGLRAVIRQMQLWLGGGDPSHIKNDYELSLQKGALHLVPRDAKLRARIASVDVEFDDKTLLPRTVRVGEAGGDQTAISFSSLKKK